MRLAIQSPRVASMSAIATSFEFVKPAGRNLRDRWPHRSASPRTTPDCRLLLQCPSGIAPPAWLPFQPPRVQCAVSQCHAPMLKHPGWLAGFEYFAVNVPDDRDFHTDRLLRRHIRANSSQSERNASLVSTSSHCVAVASPSPRPNRDGHCVRHQSASSIPSDRFASHHRVSSYS